MSEPRQRASDEEVSFRVHHIANMMARGEWRGMISVKACAAEWGIAPSTVGCHSAKASILVQQGFGTMNEIRTDTIAKLQNVVAVAIQRNQLMAAVKALDAIAKISGAAMPAQLMVTQVTQELELAVDRLQAVRERIGPESYELVIRALLGERLASEANGEATSGVTH